MPRMKKTSSTPAPSHRALRIVGVIYAVAAGLIVFWPSRVDAPADGLLSKVIGYLQAHGIPSWILNYSSVEFTANVLMFVPAGFILAQLLATRLKAPIDALIALILGIAASVCVELIQGALLPGRVADPRDVAANSLGTALGVLTAWVFFRRRRSAANRGTKAMSA